MKSNLFLLLLLISLFSFGQDGYKITRIKSKGNFNIIYMIRRDTTYKVVSKKCIITDCQKIKKGEVYEFALKEIKSEVSSEINCFAFDEKTEICSEDDIGLYVAENLKGLCLIATD